MTLLLLLAAALQVGPPAPPAPDQTKPATRSIEERVRVLEGTLRDGAWLTAAGMFDVYATEVALDRCPSCSEAQRSHSNPNGTTRVAAKAIAAVAVTALCHQLRKDGHHKAATWLRRTGIVVWGGAGGWNLWISR